MIIIEDKTHLRVKNNFGHKIRIKGAKQKNSMGNSELLRLKCL